MERLPLLDDPLVVGVPAKHPLAAAPDVPLADLRDEPWIAGLPGTTFGTLVQRACRAAGFEPRITHRAREFALQQSLVAAGLGVALLPTLACQPPDPAVRYLSLNPPTLTRHVYALLRRGSRQRPAVQAFLDELSRRAPTPWRG